MAWRGLSSSNFLLIGSGNPKNSQIPAGLRLKKWYTNFMAEILRSNNVVLCGVLHFFFIVIDPLRERASELALMNVLWTRLFASRDFPWEPRFSPWMISIWALHRGSYLGRKLCCMACCCCFTFYITARISRVIWMLAGSIVTRFLLLLLHDLAAPSNPEVHKLL